jgi:hypothetical protein
MANKMTEKRKNKPSILFLITMNGALLWAMDIFKTKSFLFERYGYLYSEYEGATAIIIGILLLLIGFYNAYLYFGPIKNTVLVIFKEKKWINMIYIIWLLFILFPIYSVNGSRLYIIFFILLGILNIILSIKYHFVIRKLIIYKT